MQLIARRYDTLELAHFELAGGRIVRVTRHDGGTNGHALENAPLVAPAFLDIQVNGWGGQEFSDAKLTPAAVAKIVREHDRFGVGRLCPTLTTQSFDTLAAGMRAIHSACEESPAVARRIPGIHLEGPYFAKEDGPRGAHPVEHCREPDFDEFQRLQEAAGGRIAILTMSAHFDSAAEFIARVVASGVVVAIGHTGASGQQIRAAVDAGASLSTHLGNGAHRMLRRHPNYLWDQLAEDRLMASLIVDGHHLPPEVVKCFVRGKTPERVILVSDESGLAGLPPGRYQSSGCELEILPDGRLVIAGQDQLLAGASRPISDNVANVMHFAGVDLRAAVHMATKNPARLLGLPEPGLRPGDTADLALFDLERSPDGATRLVVRQTIVGGETLFGPV